MNRKGFTLVELLGVLVILSIIMLIAVPNVISIMDKNKKDIYVSDAKKFVSAVQYELSKNNAYPTTGSCYVKLSSLDNVDMDQSPNKHDYSGNSYVVITKNGTSYTYTIYFTDGVLGINNVELSSLQRSNIVHLEAITPSGNSCLPE